MTLPIRYDFDPVNLITLSDLSESLKSPVTEKAMMDKLGAERGKAFVAYAREVNLDNFVKVFQIKPSAQFKNNPRKRGGGVHAYDTMVLEEALITAFNFIAGKGES